MDAQQRARGRACGDDIMLLNLLITVCVAGFIGLVVLGHLLLVGDFWRLSVQGVVPKRDINRRRAPVE